MYFKHAIHGLALSTAIVSAFNPYHVPTPNKLPSGRIKEVDRHEWKPLKVPRDAKPFQPVGHSVDIQKFHPVKEMKIKKIPRSGELEPEIEAIVHANAVTKKYRKRGVNVPDFDSEEALHNALANLERRGVKKWKRQNSFDFLRSNEPKTPDSLAVHQDGHDFSYFSEVQFGSSNKTFLLVVDTGSSDTWVPSSNCTSRACNNHATFGEADSTTLEFQRRNFQITYGTGDVRGIVVRDDVSFAGFRINIDFGLSTVVSSEFSDFVIDGIMGLGFPEASQQQASTIMEVLVAENLISDKLFGVALSRASDGLGDGVLHFGAVDKDYFEGDLVWVPSISEYGYWEVQLEGFSRGDEQIDFQNRTVIIDTGTSLILIPEDDAIALHDNIEGLQSDGMQFAVPCNLNETIDVTFGGVKYSIPPSDWIGERLIDLPGFCLSYIMARQILGPRTWLFGDVFLKNVYATFDMDNQKIGFAKRASPSGSVNQPPTVTTRSSSTGLASRTPAPTSTAGADSNGTNTDENSDAGGDSAASSDATVSLTVLLAVVLGSLLLGFLGL
ncbi:aspartic peptidase domain-containing protein [Kalaharituber pfeilii]|nr:aspartic peptidase domain-containing protein [Kalaharituber pfeilii]